MSRRLRFLPEEGTLVEVTCRTVHGRYLLLPSPLRDEIVLGVLDYFNSKLAKEIGRLTGWRDKVWSRRYQAIPVSQEDAAQIARFKYVLSHGVKENLVEHLRDWPGVHAVRALLDGVALEGRWFNRTLEYAARRRGEKFGPLDFSTPEIMTLAPLPCWKHLEPEQRKNRIAALVKEIEEEAAAARQRDGIQVAGVDAVLAHHPHDRPEKLKKGSAPLFHAATKEMRQFLWSLYAEFVARFRDAAERLRAGAEAVFPPGSFPPALPYVPG